MKGVMVMIFKFKTDTKPTLDQVGGKAKGLIELTNAGFPVPQGIVLSVDFFKEWLDDVKSSKQWKNFLEAGTEENCQNIVSKVQNLTFTDLQRKEIDKYLPSLQGHIFSIRSSSPEEDLEGTSFAGMYETYLGVNRDKIESFVAKVFSSCFDFRVLGYKKQNGISPNDTAIAVIIQKQIQSDVSGVAFSLNPLNNAYDEVVINASFGLGEAIVSGLVTPDIYIVDKIKNTIQEKKVSKKEIAIRLADTGEIKEEKNTKPSVVALNDEQILHLSELVCQVEKHYKKPMDTEWAIENGILFLLQARPITTHIQLFPEMITAPKEKKELYMDFILATQGFSEPMSQMGIDIWAKMVKIGNGLPRGKDGILWDIHGRHYMIMSHLLSVSPIMTKTFSSHDEPTKKIFASLDKQEFIQDKTPKKLQWFLWKTIKYMLPLYGKSILKGLFHSKRALKDYKKASGEVWNYFHEKLENSQKSFEELVNESLDGFSRLVKEVGGVLLAANLAKWKIERMFKNYEESKDLIVSLAMNLPNNPVFQMGDLMLQIASSKEFMDTKTANVFEEKLKSNSYSDTFLNLYNRYIKEFGCRGVKEIDIATPRISENIQLIFVALKQIDIKENATFNAQKRSKEAYEKLLKMAKNMGKEKKFIKLAKTYRDMIGYRDHPKYMYVVAVSLLRKKALLLAEEFVQQGRLKKTEQIFDLSILQVAQAQKDSNLELISLVEKNIAPYKAVVHIKDWPRIIDSRGKIYRALLQAKDGEIKGEAISPGLIKGKAKVLLDPYEKPIEKGEILVCKASEPSWAPVFINASGIVMEVGGSLQHGAIIAREYGLPCVSSVYDATKIIKDGDIIEVDGFNGIIKIVK